MVVDPDPRCAATYVNDAIGPDRSPEAKRELRAKQNVAFRALRDGAGLPHAFWQVLQPIEPGEPLLGDYGDGYWRKHGSKTTMTASGTNNV